jgi:predicted transcriptional regulator
MTQNKTNVLLDNNLVGQARRIARQQRTNLSRVIEQAVREYLDRQLPAKSQPHGGLDVPQDLTQRAEKIRRRLHRPEGW